MTVRLAYAATHLVMADSYADVAHSLASPGSPEEIAEHIDWPATLGLRSRLDSLGFGIAEAMDTAQRFEIGWENAERLIQGCGALHTRNGFVAGAGVDHLDAVDSPTDLIDGVVLQARTIQDAGGIPILLPLLWLAENKASEEDYVSVYSEIVKQLDGPLYVHWLGEMFHPGLAGYFPGESFDRILACDPSKVRGAKLSLLDAEFERELRARILERDQIVLTGDDFHFAELIAGEDRAVLRTTKIGELDVPVGRFSHALLGVFDAIAQPASIAFEHLAAGDVAAYTKIMTPCETLGQWLFQAPTRHYKAGLAFLAWLNGLQSNAMIANHEERARDAQHYRKAFELATAAGAIEDLALAQERMLEAEDWWS